MNKLEQAARPALEALIKANHFHDYEDEITALREALEQHKPHEEYECNTCLNYFTDKAHKEALAEQPVQEPIVFYRCNGCGHAYESFAPSSCDCMEGQGFSRIEYCAATVRTKDLTDDDLRVCFKATNTSEPLVEGWSGLERFARAVIAADREKNK